MRHPRAVHRRSIATAARSSVSSIFSWREKEFIAAYADKAPPAFANRSPIERAVLAFVEPKLLGTEKEFLDEEHIPADLHRRSTGR